MSIRFRPGGRKVSPPGPTFMNEEQLAQYLKDLRSNRPPRPNGSRPLPPRASSSLSTHTSDIPPRASSALSNTRPSEQQTHLSSGDIFPRSNSAFSHRRGDSQYSIASGSSGHGQHESPIPELARALSPTPTVMSSGNPNPQYRESGHRWLERQEARSLRYALEEMDMMDEEMRLQVAAQEEATELVMQHQQHGFAAKNPHAPYRNPDTNHVSRFRSHLERNGHIRSHSHGGYAEPAGDLAGRDGYRSASGSSDGSLHGTDIRGPSSARPNGSGLAAKPESNGGIFSKKNGSLRRKNKVNFSVPEDQMGHGQMNATRARTPSNDSSKGIFRNPEDFIYEEPEEPEANNQRGSRNVGNTAPVLTAKPRNSLGWGSVGRGARPKSTGLFSPRKNAHQNKIHASTYTSNNFTGPRPDSAEEKESVPTKNGIEIRGDDIRAATSRKLKDRSSKLPTPSAVSDRPGRPIVSFDPGWKSPDENVAPPEMEVIPPETDPRRGSGVPTISVSDEDHQVPSISVSGPSSAASGSKTSSDKPSARPLPTPGQHNQGSARQRRHKDTSIELRGPASFRGSLPRAACAACGLPISGRIVTASDSRLHPECFTCHHCSTPLECVAFYEEPAAKREERLATSEVPEEDARTPRFYCHLDFHEMFSPRCKHCTTPIEGEVIVACGAEWHAGHFFCAECGDPFTQTTPFVESGGYAWCLKCHSRRTASKCQGCKLPVVEDVVITALGGDWHEKCFVCTECRGGFGPEGRFFVREGEPRVTAKGRRIGGPVQLAVCEGCESRRLRA